MRRVTSGEAESIWPASAILSSEAREQICRQPMTATSTTSLRQKSDPDSEHARDTLDPSLTALLTLSTKWLHFHRKPLNGDILLRINRAHHPHLNARSSKTLHKPKTGLNPRTKESLNRWLSPYLCETIPMPPLTKRRPSQSLVTAGYVYKMRMRK